MRFVHFRLVGPAIAGIALLLIGMATFPYLGVAQIDTEARQRQETLVKRNIALWITDIEFSLTAWTIWDEAIAKIDNGFDFEWADRNIGASLIGTSRTRFAAVLDPNDTETDPITNSINVMKEVITVLGPTPNTTLGKGVREWCINAAAIDPVNKCAVVNCEDETLPPRCRVIARFAPADAAAPSAALCMLRFV